MKFNRIIVQQAGLVCVIGVRGFRYWLANDSRLLHSGADLRGSLLWVAMNSRVYDSIQSCIRSEYASFLS